MSADVLAGSGETPSALGGVRPILARFERQPARHPTYYRAERTALRYGARVRDDARGRRSPCAWSPVRPAVPHDDDPAGWKSRITRFLVSADILRRGRALGVRGASRRLQDAFGGASGGRRVLGAEEFRSRERAECFRRPPKRLHRVRTLRMRVGGCCSFGAPHVLSHACTSSSAMYSPAAS